MESVNDPAVTGDSCSTEGLTCSTELIAKINTEPDKGLLSQIDFEQDAVELNDLTANT